MHEEQPPIEVGARGRLCPEPVLMARAALDGVSAGETIKLLATDPHAALDVEVFCARSGHVLEQSEEQKGTWIFWIRKS